MTRDEAVAEAQRRQAADPTAKWIATEKDGAWAVARIGVKPTRVKPTGTSTQPPPQAPREPAHSEQQRIITQYGAGG